MASIPRYCGYKPIGPDYEEYMHSQAWRDRAERRRRMDKYTCQICGMQAYTLDVHHLTYARFKHENVITDLITLCRECHLDIHDQKDREKHAEKLERIAKDTSRNRWLSAFYDAVKCKDRFYGGDLNLCYLADIEKAYNEYIIDHPQPFEFAYKSYVQERMRDTKVVRIFALKRLGYTDKQIIRLGTISKSMVTKWYHGIGDMRSIRADIEELIEKEIQDMAKLSSFAGFTATQTTERKQLPADQAFVAKIRATKLEETSFGKRIVFQLEITEGEYKDFFMTDFNAQKGGQYEPKYRGIYRLNVPSGDGSERDGWAVNRFNRAMGDIEASNLGYRWDWDTDSLKGKSIGFVTRLSEFNDREYTEIGMLISADNARSGKFKPMKKREQRVAAPAPAPTVQPVASAWDETDEDVPF